LSGYGSTASKTRLVFLATPPVKDKRNWSILKMVVQMLTMKLEMSSWKVVNQLKAIFGGYRVERRIEVRRGEEEK
jgi:hypothetical protein